MIMMWCDVCDLCDLMCDVMLGMACGVCGDVMWDGYGVKCDGKTCARYRTPSMLVK